MKIVDRAKFLGMPPGTLFAKYEPSAFGELAIKGDTVVGVDFIVQGLVPWPEGCSDSGEYFDTLEAMERGESSGPLDFDCGARDGLFDQEQLFAVFEPDDVARLIARLQQAQAEAVESDLPD